MIKRVMTITHAEFFRLLPKALAGHHHVVNGHSICVATGSGSLEIELSPENLRKFGSLDLMVTQGTFHFQNSSDEVRKNFLDRFEMTYYRGGG